MQEYTALGKDLVSKLKKVKAEATIKKYCDEVTNSVWASSDNKGTIKNRMVAIRKLVKEAFPDTDEQEHPWQYFTNSGKGNIPRYEHLAFKYLPTADKKQPDQLIEKDTQIQPSQQPAKQAKKQPEAQHSQPQATLEDMKIEQLNLDAETQSMVENAIAYSGISLADFIRRACQVYAKTITGKVKLADEDLSAVSTADLLSEKYKTHPARADELTRRAIYALEAHNNNCTERRQKWHINQTAIQTLTGSKPATIKKILEKYQTRLDDHNAKHELNTYDNRKAWIKIDKAINLVNLVPNGLDIV